MDDIRPTEQNTNDAPQPAAAPEKTSVWEDFIDIFYAPSAVFRRRENGSWVIPLLVVTIAGTIIGFAISGALQPMFEAEFRRNMANSGRQMPAEAMAGAQKFADIARVWGALVLYPLLIIIAGCIAWLVGKLVDSRQTLHAALMVAGYAYMVRVLDSILSGIQSLILDPTTLTSHYALQIGPARFLNPDTASPMLIAILGRLDLITIWLTVLLAIGVAVTGKLTRRRGVIVGVVLWVIGSLPAIMGALQQQ